MMERALDFRMAKGFCVPIHYGDGGGDNRPKTDGRVINYKRL